MSCRVLLVEDHPLMRKGYAALIGREPDLVICGEAASAEGALAAVPALRPDVVVADLALPGLKGIAFIERLCALDASGAVLVVSAHEEFHYAERALVAGARGYLMKTHAAENVVEAIRRVHGGHIYLSDRMRTRIAQSYVGPGAPPWPLAR